MTEWLTENVRRAYPLEHELPRSAPEQLSRLLLDACIGYSGSWEEKPRVMLLDVSRAANAVVLRIGTGNADSTEVRVVRPEGQYGTVFASAERYRVLLTVSRRAYDELTASGWSGSVSGINIPFAMRCVSTANRFVSAVEAYAPAKEEVCSKPLWPGWWSANRVKTATGDVVLVSKDGIDVDVTQMPPVTGSILRVTAITAPLDSVRNDKPVDMVIRGDECVQVDTLPGMKVTSGNAVVLWDTPEVAEKYPGPYGGELSCGVIRITEKCKQCCQCSDYADAAESLRPAHNATFSVQKVLEEAKMKYEAAVEAFNAAKENALSEINSYNNIIASAVAVTSGSGSTGVTASGTRMRMTISLTIVNMTMDEATISSLVLSIPGGSGYGLYKTSWSKAGGSPSAGSSIAGLSLVLSPGDTLSVVATYVKTGTTNVATKPDGMKAMFSAQLMTRTEAEPFEVTIT